MRLVGKLLLILIAGVGFAVFVPVVLKPGTENLRYCNAQGCVQFRQYESLTHAAFCIDGIDDTTGGAYLDEVGICGLKTL